MRKTIALLLTCLLLLAPSSLAIDVYVDGEKLVTDTDPVITGGRTIVPVRPIFEALGADILWDGVERSVTATKGDITVYLKIDDTTAYVNGEAKLLDVPAKILNNRTMVPARFVSEALKAEVRWDNDTRTVYVTSAKVQQAQGVSVYVTPTGKRYHHDQECAGPNAIHSTLDAATSRGLTPCQICTK